MFIQPQNLVRSPLLENGDINANWLYYVSGAYASPLYKMLATSTTPMPPDSVQDELERFCVADDSAAIIAFLVKLYALNQDDVPEEILEILECPKAVVPFALELIEDLREIIEEESFYAMKDEVVVG